MPKQTWTTAVGEVAHGTVRVRGYALDEVIRNLGFGAACFLTIRGELPDAHQARVTEAALCAILEHGFYAPTTLATRTVVSAAPDDLIKGLAAGLLTIGSVTASPQHSAEIIVRVETAVRDGASESAAMKTVALAMVENGERMPGIGHPLHPDGDPRAIALEEVARAEGVLGRPTEYFHGVRDEYLVHIGRSLPVNVDGMLGCVLHELGFAPMEMPGLAAISFLPGLIAHAMEEAAGPLSLRIADGEYTGVPARSFVDAS